MYSLFEQTDTYCLNIITLEVNYVISGINVEQCVQFLENVTIRAYRVIITHVGPTYNYRIEGKEGDRQTYWQTGWQRGDRS